MYYIPSGDPVEDFKRKDWDDFKWLQSRPQCSECLEDIQEDYYYQINGRTYCEHCMNSYKKYLED